MHRDKPNEVTLRVQQQHRQQELPSATAVPVGGPRAEGRRRGVVGARGDVGPPEVHARRRRVRAVRYREVDADVLTVQLVLVRLAARLPRYMHTHTAIQIRVQQDTGTETGTLHLRERVSDLSKTL